MKILKKFLGQYIIIGLFVFFLVFSIITGFIFQIQKIKEYNLEISKLDTQIEDTKEEINKLKKSSKGNLEEIARQQLGMVKKGEIIYLNSNQRDN